MTATEERDFFLRSLRDLEAERDAGDIDEADYRALKDDYTARAAEAIRRAEHPGEPAPAPPPKRRRRRKPWTRLQKGMVVAIVACLGAAAGWQFSHRPAVTTLPRHLSAAQVTTLLDRAATVAPRDPVRALADYRQILAVYPEQPQALTEEGWLLVQGGELGAGEADLRLAEEVDPSWDLPHGYRGIALFGENDYAGAVMELTYYLAHGPDPALVGQARASLVAAQKDLDATKP